MFSMGCTNTTGVAKIRIICAGSIVTVDLERDVLTPETARDILTNNEIYEACVNGEKE